RVMLDDRDGYTPGWKYAEWELRGVPLRFEIGPKDLEKGQVFAARRDTREKFALPFDGIAAATAARLGEIQAALLARARAFRDENTHHAATWDEFKALMEGRPGFVIASWCGSDDCEAKIKTETQATLRNIPLDAPEAPGTCVHCGNASRVKAWFAKAY